MLYTWQFSQGNGYNKTLYPKYQAYSRLFVCSFKYKYLKKVSLNLAET